MVKPSSLLSSAVKKQQVEPKKTEKSEKQGGKKINELKKNKAKNNKMLGVALTRAAEVGGIRAAEKSRVQTKPVSRKNSEPHRSLPQSGVNSAVKIVNNNWSSIGHTVELLNT